MKYKVFSVSAISIIMAAMTHDSIACGPFPPIIPTPEFLKTNHLKRMTDYDKEENLLLWQAITCDGIPLSDIEQVVYKDSRETVYNQISSHDENKNLLYRYIKNSFDKELEDFLLTAKSIEEEWHDMQSPWYYPQDRNDSRNGDRFQYYINICNKYEGTRLRERYSLQIIRALFASHRFEECIEYFDSVFTSFPNTNLMKRMAQRYVAGCWKRLGEDTRSDSIFARAGDIWSIGADDKVAYMTEHNPNAPQIMEYIRSQKCDSAYLAPLVPLATKMLKQESVINKGDWAYLLAYFYNEHTMEKERACRLIRQALKDSFSTEELHDLALTYKMKIDAQLGYTNTLLQDLKWMEEKCSILQPYSGDRIRYVRNIIYVDWIPELWRKKDYSTAIMLASYADNIGPSQQWQCEFEFNGTSYSKHSLTIEEMRKSNRFNNGIDYSMLAFQMMGSLSSSELANTYRKIMETKPLNNFLRKNGRFDSDYYFELIGTLALREENYPRAIEYLRKVSIDYQHTMNIFKEGYLGKDPFANYPSRWDGLESDTDWDDERAISGPAGKSKDNAKLDFAVKMLKYKRTMLKGKTGDERGLARLMYAIGRRNSFEECWALTQYWRGSYAGLFSPDLDYWEYDFAKDNYAFLYDYVKSKSYRETEALYKKEIAAALSVIRSDETRAKAEYVLGNLKTVIKKYPDSSTAHFVKTNCDNWHQWL